MNGPKIEHTKHYTDAAKEEIRDLRRQIAALEARSVVSDDKFSELMRDICEMEVADPLHDATVCVNYDELYNCIRAALQESDSE